MNPSEINSPAPADLDSLQRELLSLHGHLVTTLMLLLLVALGLNAFLFYTLRSGTKEKTMVQNIILQHRQVVVPNFINIYNRLTDFAKTHPDFQAVMAKYPIQFTLPAPPSGTTAPAKAAPPAPAPKK